MRAVPDSIQAAPSGRAKCKGCGNLIAKGELRFGETGPSSYGEGDATSWFHLACAAMMRPEKSRPVLESAGDEIPDRAWLLSTAELGVAHPRLSRLTRAERASSGRAHCRSCREPIAKGDWRFALTLFEDARPNPIGTIHASCAQAYFGTADVLERAVRLTPGLSADDRADLERALAQQRPGLAKTQGSDEEGGAEVGSGSA